jgi:hypothetical protein
MVEDLGPWRYQDRSCRLKFFANQGLTTVAAADGSISVLYRGDYSIPRRVKQEGWVHIGDPDSSRGYVFDAYQGATGATSKNVRGHHPGRRQL